MSAFVGKVVIVAGGATSIGAAIARRFHEAGAAVAILDLDAGAGEALAASLGARGRFHRTDITDDGAIAAFVTDVVAAFGGVDRLVNLVCHYGDRGLQSSRAEWLHSLNVNLVSGAMLVAAVVPEMTRRGGGSIVNLSSVAGKFGQAGRALYPAAKAAILQLTRSEAMELAPAKIRVNAVSPAWTWSTAVARASSGDREKADRVAADYHPLGRVGDAEDVAAAVLFLCSDEARFITGIDLPVDGGYAMTGPDGGKPAMGRLAQ